MSCSWQYALAIQLKKQTLHAFLEHFNPWSIPVSVLGKMLGTRSMTAKTRFTAPEALVMSGKACCALATPKAENAMQKNTCSPAH